MILADASVWIDHIRKPDVALSALLERREVLTHPFLIGEIALGYLIPRERLLADLRKLESAEVANDPEVLRYIERFGLFGRGIGYIDVHLLASTMLTDECALWTRDKRLRDVAEQLGLIARGLN